MSNKMTENKVGHVTTLHLYHSKQVINPWSPNSDKHLISPYNITTWTNIQIMRIKGMITNDQLSWFLIKFSQLVT